MTGDGCQIQIGIQAIGNDTQGDPTIFRLIVRQMLAAIGKAKMRLLRAAANQMNLIRC